MIINALTFYGGGSATVEEFLLTFDDISVVDSIIDGNKTSVADWNTFFNSATGTPFTSVEIIVIIVQKNFTP